MIGWGMRIPATGGRLRMLLRWSSAVARSALLPAVGPRLGVAQPFEGFPIGAAFRDCAFPTAIPLHSFDLQPDLVAIGATTHFRVGHARKGQKRQSQKDPDRHVSLQSFR